jgi:hypothetical protein
VPTPNDEFKQFTDDWIQRIRTGLDFRKKYSSEKKWPAYRKYYRGHWENNILPVNRTFSYGRNLIPRVYFRSPRVTVTPTRPDLAWHARVVEEIDNQLIQQTFLKGTLKKGSLISYLCGVGPIKLGYDSEFGFDPSQIISQDGSTATQESRSEPGERIEYHEGIVPGYPWALPVQPEDVVVPWGSTDAQSLPWIAHRIYRPLDDVQQDQKYLHTKELKGSRQPDANRRWVGGRRIDRDKDIPFAELWEVRDYKSRSIFTFCENTLILSQNDALQAAANGLPWEFITWNEDPEYFWPISDVDIIEPQQLELNETRTQESRHRRITLLKFLYKKGAFSPEMLDHFLSGEVGPAVEVNEAEILANAIITLQPHIPPDLRGAVNQCLIDMQESLGFGPNQSGQYKTGTPPSASEGNIVNQTFESRIDERQDILGDVLARIIRKWNKYIFSFWTESKVIQITSPQGTPFWVQYTGDQIKGDYLLNVDTESGMPVSRTLRYQMAENLFKQFNGDQLVDQLLLRKIYLDTFSQVEPLVRNLLTSPEEVNPQEEGLRRQPLSPGGKTGKPQDIMTGIGNRGGGPKAPGQVIPLDRLAKGGKF